MKRKNYFTLLLAFVISSLLFSVPPLMAQRTSGQGRGNRNQSRNIQSGETYSRFQHGKNTNSGRGINSEGYICETGQESCPQYLTEGPLYNQNGFAGPKWFTDPEGFCGQGPTWLLNPQEGVGPWFWQAYNGYDVSAIAPVWYVDPTTAEYFPAWYADGTNAPWWTSYILESE